MKASFLTRIALGLWLVAPAIGVAAEATTPCDTGETQQKLVKESTVFHALGAALFTEDCSGLMRVMRLILGEITPPGGRKLKPLSGLDHANAKAQYAEALANPAFVADLQARTANWTDPIVRKIIEAALLDDHGYYGAQMLLVQELRATAGVSR